MLNENLIRRDDASAANVPNQKQTSEALAAPARTIPTKVTSGNDVADLREAILAKLAYVIGKAPSNARERDWFAATALALRDRIVDACVDNERAVPNKRVYYLSLEFLIGRLLSDAMNNLGLVATTRAALRELGIDLGDVEAAEPDAALGNGGLGRLAACFMESMASLSIPAIGYGIRYDHGLFRQSLEDGWQKEAPETWLAEGNPWEFVRPEATYTIGFGGHVTMSSVTEGVIRRHWCPAETVRAVAHDVPVVGWRGRHVNTLRLWKAEAETPVELERFNGGDHVGAVAGRARAEAISRVLYPSDSSAEGQELRLRQEYFFTSASLQDLLRRHVAERGDLRSLPDHAAIQLNDTHPAIAVPELMRLLLEDHGLNWEDAWHITTHTLGYTNHTLLPEALETWPVELMERVLPRHMQIIYLINWMHLEEAGQAGSRNGRAACLGLTHRREPRQARAHGPSRLSRRAARQRRLRPAYGPDALDGVQGPARPRHRQDRQQDQRITFRRWLHNANPELTALAVEAVGPEVLDHPRASRRPRRHGVRFRLPGPLRGHAPGPQAGARPRGGGAHRHRGRPLGPVRRADQAHPRVQAPASQRHRDGGPVPGDQGRSDGGLDAAREDLRRKGGAELCPGQAHHQARL